MAYFNGLYTQLLEFEYLLNSFIDIEELKKYLSSVFMWGVIYVDKDIYFRSR